MENIDFLCAKCGKKIIDNNIKDENDIQKSLGVLQEDGLYAFVVYSKSKSKNTKKILSVVENFLKNKMFISANLEEKEIYENLEKLLLIKNMVEKILIYTKYYAKAKSE